VTASARWRGGSRRSTQYFSGGQNRVDGVGRPKFDFHAGEHPTTLQHLKKQSSLFVMSDWLATHSTEAITKGLDQEMPSDYYFGSRLRDAVRSGAVDEGTIDAAALSVLRAMDRVGALDRAPRGDLRADVSTPSNRDIARRVAAHAIVLLKNNNILPLDTCARLVLVGDLQNYTVGGGSGRVVGRTVSLAEAFETRCGFVEAYADLQTKTARDAVATATTVLVVTGSQSTEGADRSTLALDGEAMIEAAAKLNPSIIVACAAPGAFLTGWRDTVQAILTTWPGGQELANALVDVLFGDVNPSGRLPLTLPMTETDLKFTQRMYPGLPDPAPPKGCADPCLRVFYDEKLEVGYRRYDSRNIKPAYAFGHGRSYTSFVYGNLTVSRTACTFDVRNVGGVAGAEVAQLYVVPPSSRGYQQLKGFHKTAVLAPGCVERVTLRFDARTFSAFLDGAWRPVPGAHELRVGASSRDARLRRTVDV
jgi:beta-glucosidase